jgi:hypothetical protein
MNYLLRPVFQFFKSRGGDQCDVVFLTHDISKHVPLAKASTQITRNSSKDVTPLFFDVETQKDKPILTLEGPVPDWGQLCANREAKTYVMQNIHDMIVEHYTPPDGKYLVLDGEFAGNKHVPCVIYKRDGREHDNERVVDYIPDWHSIQGEADIRIFTLMHYIIPQFEDMYLRQTIGSHETPVLNSTDVTTTESLPTTNTTSQIQSVKPPRVVIVNCIDTDVQCISILQSPKRLATAAAAGVKFDFEYEVYIKCGEVEVSASSGTYVGAASKGKRKATSISSSTVGASTVGASTVKRSEYLNCNRAFQEMAATCIQKNPVAGKSREWVVNAVRSLVLSACMGEMDFNDGYPGLTHPGFYNAYKQHFREVGLLVEDLSPIVLAPTAGLTSTDKVSHVNSKNESANHTTGFTSTNKAHVSKMLDQYTRLNIYQESADTERGEFSTPVQHLIRAHVDLNAYIRLLKAAYYEKHQKGLLREHKVKSIKEADWEILRTYVIKHTPNSEEKRVANSVQIWNRYQRFQSNHWMN